MSWPDVSWALGVLGAGKFTRLRVSATASWSRVFLRGGPEFLRVHESQTVWVGRWRVDGRWAGTPGGREGGGESRAGPGAGRTARAGGGAARLPHFGEVGRAEAGPGRARSPGKEGGGRREGRSRSPWGRGPGAATAA